MKKIKICFFILLFILLNACNDKNDVRNLLKQANIEYKEKNYTEARILWEKAAHLNSGEAEYQLSRLYALGQGVEENTERYFELLENAAEKGELKALKTLGNEYYSGNVITRDYGKAFRLLKEAAIRGDVESQVYLGRMYGYGYGVEKNPEKALEWYRKAANENNSSALLEIGRMYQDGNGVKKDMHMAISYFERAIKDSDTLIDISSNVTISSEITNAYFQMYFDTGNIEYKNNFILWEKKREDFFKREKELLGKFK